jgi:WD40 repeat protein
MCAAQQWLVTGGGDGQVKAWNYVPDATGGGKWNLHGLYGGDSGAHSAEVVAMSAKCPGSLITASSAGDLKSWRLVDGTVITDNKQGHVGAISAIDVLSVDPETHFVVTCGEQDSFVRLWSAPALVPLYQITVQPPSGAPGMAARPHNPTTAMKIVQVGQQQHLFVGMRNGTVNVYHMKDQKHFEKLGFVDGHQRKAKIIGFDTISTGVAMLCVVTDKGFVNWFRLAQ